MDDMERITYEIRFRSKQPGVVYPEVHPPCREISVVEGVTTQVEEGTHVVAVHVMEIVVPDIVLRHDGLHAEIVVPDSHFQVEP